MQGHFSRSCMSQLHLFDPPNPVLSLGEEEGEMPSIAADATVDQLLSQQAPVAIGISGGKDSTACAWAVVQHLNRIGHTGPRLLIHADLGQIEWQDSARICARLASRLALPLVTVSRKKGGMIERWNQRWEDNLARYKSLSCVSLILPWSTPGMRFCTGELKTSVICQKLTELFPGQTIISVTGVRRSESKARSKTPVHQVQQKLIRKKIATSGIDWNPLVNWSTGQIWALHRQQNLPIHEAYREFGCSRVSCSFCIMSSGPDLIGALKASHNHTAFLRLVRLECESGFSFKSKTWLGELAPQLLTDTQKNAHWQARVLAQQRDELQKLLPRRIKFVKGKGWPSAMINEEDARLLASVRQQIAKLYGWSDMGYTTPEAVRQRYQELLIKKARKERRPIEAEMT